MRRRVLEVAHGYQLVGGGIIAITSNDLQKNEITGKVFETEHEYREWEHDASLRQLPEWHKRHCLQCKVAHQ